MLEFKEIRNRSIYTNRITVYYNLDIYLEFRKAEISDPYERLRFLRTLTRNRRIERADEITFRLPTGSCKGLRTIFRSRKLMLSYLINQHFYQAIKEANIEVFCTIRGNQLEAGCFLIPALHGRPDQICVIPTNGYL